jgi:uncharacterized protein (DUF2252 family)
MNIMQEPAVPSQPHGNEGLRRTVNLAAQAEWSPASDRADPTQILIDQGENRITSLLPVRYARMQTDPFAFFRGAAAIMAADLAQTPISGIRLQSCGDAHLANFGAYASPEGRPIFDLNDFDETLPAPFEWDVKRLATSLALAGHVASVSATGCRKLARRAARAYRERVGVLAQLPPVEAWSNRIDLKSAIADVDEGKLRRALEKRLHKILKSGAEHFGLLERYEGAWRIKPFAPLAPHLPELADDARSVFASYGSTLQEDRRVLLERYSLRDVAFKVVGVGSVGTFCAIGLFVSAGDAPLLLQIKQAQNSVLAPFAGDSEYINQGQRVVVGQRMLQAATDVFLGWTRAPISDRAFYVRRLKDARLAGVGERLEETLPFYATLCGHTLARAHVRAGDAPAIAAHLGDDHRFEEAIADFAMAYAQQTERDWHRFQQAIAAGHLQTANHVGDETHHL